MYRRAGVQEYVVWQVYEGRIDWFGSRQGKYERAAPEARAVSTSAVFPGLRRILAKMPAGDDVGVLAELTATGQNPDHA